MPASTVLYTYRDLIDHLVAYSGGVGHAAQMPRVRFAIQQAYRNLVNFHNWLYLFRQRKMLFSAPYTTGTIAYDHTGGTYERMVTMTTGTVPSWVAEGHLKIGNSWYEVESRKSGSVFTLKENNNPGEDVASGTSYTIYRSRYLLDADFRRTHSPMVQAQGSTLKYVRAQDWQFLETQVSSSGTPRLWTVMGDTNIPGRLSMYLYPYPSTSIPVTMLYMRLARDMKLDGTQTSETAGTVSWTAGSTTLTGSGTSFSAKHVGAVIRAGTSAESPDGIEGANPYQEQLVISSVASATSATLLTEPATSVSGVKYCISDPADVSQHMLDALFRGCEVQLAIGNKDRAALGTLSAAYEDAIRRALGADNIDVTEIGNTESRRGETVEMTPYTTALNTQSGDLEV